MSFLSDLAAVASLAPTLNRVADALDRIARAQEVMADLAPAPVVDDAPAEPPTVGVPADGDTLMRADLIEQWFVAMNHRRPTPDEVLRELDGLPIDPDEASRELAARVFKATRG